MHFVFVSVGGSGHVNPTLGVVRELVDRGHRVTYGTDEKFRTDIESAGGTLLPMPGAMPAGMPGGQQGGFNPEMMVGMMGYLAQSAREGLAVLEKHLQQDRPDAVCYDNMTLQGRFVAEKLQSPSVALHPSYATNEHFSFGSLLQHGGSGSVPPQYMRTFFEMMREMLAELAAEVGVEPTDPFNAPPAPVNIVFLPRQFQFEADTFDERFHFVGPCVGTREFDDDWQPPQTSQPLLFVSLGTTPLNNKPDFFRTCLDAFGDGQWHVAMAVGEHVDPAQLGTIPDNVEIRPFFPQPAVLRHADVFLSHTGMNSTMESLYYAVPLVAVPQQPEQDANARQVENLGLGRRLTGDLTAEILRHSVDEVHADDDIHANITDMSKVVRNSGGATAAADAIEAHLR